MCFDSSVVRKLVWMIVNAFCCCTGCPKFNCHRFHKRSSDRVRKDIAFHSWKSFFFRGKKLLMKSMRTVKITQKLRQFLKIISTAILRVWNDEIKKLVKFCQILIKMTVLFEFLLPFPKFWNFIFRTPCGCTVASVMQRKFREKKNEGWNEKEDITVSFAMERTREKSRSEYYRAFNEDRKIEKRKWKKRKEGIIRKSLLKSFVAGSRKEMRSLFRLYSLVSFFLPKGFFPTLKEKHRHEERAI